MDISARRLGHIITLTGGATELRLHVDRNIGRELVRRVNAHDELVAAVTELVRAWDRILPGTTLPLELHDHAMWARARDVIDRLRFLGMAA